MSSTRGTGYILCPFYRYHDMLRHTIGCEGYTDTCSVITSFDTCGDMTQQMSIFCKANYQRCEVYRMVHAAKYEDEPCGE